MKRAWLKIHYSGFFLFLVLLGMLGPGAHAQISGNLFGGGWNNVSATPPPPVWCPTDSTGAILQSTGFRIWDDGMKWSQIETSNGVFTWTKMDEAINNLVTNPSCRMRVIYTYGATPQWATACNGSGDPSTCLPGPVGSGYGGGINCANPDHWSCLPPSDLNTDGTGADALFSTFVATLVGRYAGKIAFYGETNEADSTNFWCAQGGTVPCGGGNANTTPNTPSLQRLIRMMWDAKQITHCLDPAAQFLSPGFHVATASTWMHQFVVSSISAPAGVSGVNGVPVGCNWSAQTVTGNMVFDITNSHMRGAGSGACSPNSDPTNVICAYNAAATEISADSLPTGLFNDEFGYVGLSQAPNTAIQSAYVAIEYSLMSSFSAPPILYGGWYEFDANAGPLQGTVVGLAFNTVRNWLVGSTVSNYSLNGTIYSVPGTFPSTQAFTITWDMSQTCATPTTCTTTNRSEPGFNYYVDLAGVRHSISGTAPVGLQPILLSSAPVAATPTFSPIAGSYTSAQAVTLHTSSAGAIMCYTTNGSTPATNGAAGCTTGTLYSGPVTVSSSLTLQAVAGGTGFSDSAVGSAVYTIAAPIAVSRHGVMVN